MLDYSLDISFDLMSVDEIVSGCIYTADNDVGKSGFQAAYYAIDLFL